LINTFMAEQQQLPPAAAAALSIALVALSKFWQGSPDNWFRNVEAQFAVRGVTDPIDKYYLVMAALSEAQMDLFDGVVPDKPDKNSYNIKPALVATHALTPYQQVDRLMAMEPLGGRKPSELLAAMQKLRPAANDASLPGPFYSASQGRSGCCWREMTIQTCAQWPRRLTTWSRSTSPSIMTSRRLQLPPPPPRSYAMVRRRIPWPPLHAGAATRASRVGRSAAEAAAAAVATAARRRLTYTSPHYAITTCGTVIRRTSVLSHEPGRETDKPGLSQRREPR
jgi:hypothetical protein